MNKAFIILTLISAFAFNAHALQCEVAAASNKHRVLKHVKIVTQFEQLTTVKLSAFSAIEFTVKDVRTSPDTFIQYIEVVGTSESACQDIALFSDKSVYNGIAKTCTRNEIPGFDLVTIACLF